jgi:hypothetical protein
MYDELGGEVCHDRSGRLLVEHRSHSTESENTEANAIPQDPQPFAHFYFIKSKTL